MGFISKMSSGKMMVSALRIVLDGGIYFPPQLLPQSDAANAPIKQNNKTDELPNNFGLTKRQSETLHYLAAGLSNKEIAQKMRLAEGTIKVHVAATYQVLQVSSRLDAVRKARQLGLLTSTRKDEDGV